VWAPKCDPTEALTLELAHFTDCILNDRTPLNDGKAGLRVVKLLDAADRSLKDRGRIVSV
jgi:predicted dehydrogenase